MISWTLKGMNTARLSVVRVRKALSFRVPMGSTVFKPSICWYLRTAIWHIRFLAVERMASVSISSCSLVSAVMTMVRMPKIIRWSRVVRSSRNSLLSFRCNSIS